MPVCDGCGTRADEAHVRRRVERLELATRYRPVHIKVLLLDGAPPARMEDYFYQAVKDRSVRSIASRMYFDELVKCAGGSPPGEVQEETVLADFQRRGFFLTYAVECPFEDQPDPQGALRRLAPTVLKRVQTSYNPSYVVPLSPPTQELIRLFGLVGWGDRLILNNGAPFSDPYLGDPKRQAEAGTGYGGRIKKLLAALP
ncbi:MAG: hypothetical protein WB780_10670 [Candidatus Acidiferrales bacterium]